MLNGANPLAVLADNGEWEVIQYLSAELIAPGVYVLSGLLRGQAGSGSATAAGASAGASVVVLDSNLVRATISQSERGLPLTWRAAPSGGAAGGLAMTEVEFTWSALALRPFAPAHLKARRLADGTLRFAWIRRTRLGGDPWTSGEVPLSEASESYRFDIVADGAVVRSLTVVSPTADYGVGDQATDFPSGMPWPLTVEVRQGSDIYGWGSALRRAV